MTLEFCSISMDRSRKDSSRDDTVSHVRHRVSLVRTPSKSLCTSVASRGKCPEFEFEPELVVFVFDATVISDADRSSL